MLLASAKLLFFNNKKETRQLGLAGKGENYLSMECRYNSITK